MCLNVCCSYYHLTARVIFIFFGQIWVCEIIYVYLGLVHQAITGIYFIEYVFKHFLKVDFDSKFHAVFVKRGLIRLFKPCFNSLFCNIYESTITMSIQSTKL